MAGIALPDHFELEILGDRIENHSVAAQTLVLIARYPKGSDGILRNDIPHNNVMFVDIYSRAVAAPAILGGVPIPAGDRVMLQMEAF